jgi:hypothetical protein
MIEVPKLSSPAMVGAIESLGIRTSHQLQNEGFAGRGYLCSLKLKAISARYYRAKQILSQWFILYP